MLNILCCIIHTFKTTIDANLELKLDDEMITDYEVVNATYERL